MRNLASLTNHTTLTSFVSLISSYLLHKYLLLSPYINTCNISDAMKLKLAYLRYDEMGHTKAIEKKRAQAAIEYDTSTYAINRKWNLGAKQQLWVIEQALRPTVSVAMVARAAQIPRQDVIDLLYRHLNNIKRQPHKYK